MVATILNAFRVADIRKKLLFTAVMLGLYRLGAWIPVPGVNTAAVEQISSNYAGSNILGFLNLFTGGGLSRIAIFALGIMPYITASIILQLLTVVSRLPAGIEAWWKNPDQVFKVMMPFVALGVIAAIVFVQEGQRQIPIQYAKRVIGRRMSSG